MYGNTGRATPGTTGAGASTGSSDTDGTDEEEEEDTDRDGESGDEITQFAQQLSEPEGTLPISEHLQVNLHSFHCSSFSVIVSDLA